MSKITIQLPKLGNEYVGSLLRDLARQVEQTFARITEDRTVGQTSVSGDYTVAMTDSLLLVDTASGNIVVTLPLVDRWMIDEKLTKEVVKIASANYIRVLPQGTDTINDEPDAFIYDKDTALAFRAFDDGWRVV